MGGHLALRAAAEMSLPFNKIIVVAPMMDIQTGYFPRRFSAVLARGVVLLGMAAWYPPGAGGYDAKARRFEGNLLTHDPMRFKRVHDQISREPRLALGNPTFGWIDAAFRSIKHLARPSMLARIQQPVLIYPAGCEAIISNPALEWLQRRLSNARSVDLVDAKHEILNETDKIRSIFWHETDIFFGV
jgi:lysophospholipase